MAGTYQIGEQKIRPGVYTRYEKTDTALVGATSGVGAAVIKANWGPLNEVVDIRSQEQLRKLYGTELTANVAKEMLLGGCQIVKVVRIGSGGTKTTTTLKDDAAADVVKITAKYESARAFQVTIKPSLSPSKTDLIITEDARQIEKYSFASDDQVNGLVQAAEGNANFIIEKVADGSAKLATLNNEAFTTAGVAPTTTTEEYDAGFIALEPHTWNVLCADTNDSAVHELVKAYINRIFEGGALPMACLAEAGNIAFDTRLQNAAKFNDEKIVYVINSAIDSDGQAKEGYLLAARIGGIIASTPANESMTHKVIDGLVDIAEPLTNEQIETALLNGALCLTMSTKGEVWIESGINTLNSIKENQDEGWKKIRRTKTRFELIHRIAGNTENLIGKVNNDAHGRSTILAAAQGVINTMIGENKLLPGGIVFEDEDRPAEGDSAWFIVQVDDLDSIEKVYLDFRFRFAG